MKPKLHYGFEPDVPFHRAHAAAAQRERGVALIITLILLAVITFMAVTFLVISRSQRGAVASTTDTTIAREGANTAQDRAIAEVLGSIIGFTNPANYGLQVSTNYVSPVGFMAGLQSFTNVSYNYPNGAPVAGNDALLNLSQLLYGPRAPVYITNRITRSNEFRYYLDLNRNGRYDTNGYTPVMTANNRFLDTNYNEIASILPFGTLSNYFVGDPEWVGVLERADLPHSSTNRFLYRYAYIIVPAGKTLDINYVHNYARGIDQAMRAQAGDGFARNQGVGTWEINLGGFLADLNTNFWPAPFGNNFGTAYYYDVSDPVNLTQPNRGAAFDDALSILRHRYAANYRNSLQNYWDSFGREPVARVAATRNFFDDYAKGPIMTNAVWTVPVDLDVNRVDTTPWSGSDNTNHYFTPSDYFDPSRTSIQFSNRLWIAGTNSDSYNRYTFYRLLSQMGSDTSADEPYGKININYDNQVQGRTNLVGITAGTVLRSATNFIEWRPVDFFTNVANKLLVNAGYKTQPEFVGDESYININHIQIYPTNFYTPSIHQLLQLAANIYDSTTNRPAPPPAAGSGDVRAPSVFRPLFFEDSGATGGRIIRIVGYEEVQNVSQVLSPGNRWHDLTVPNSQGRGVTRRDMIYGIPLVIGAKKGLPNFNELSMQTSLQVARKLEFRRQGNLNDGPIVQTNVMYTLAISNIFGLEAWNSYSSNYPRQLQMHTVVELFCSVTNEFGQVLLAYTNPPVVRSNMIVIAPNTWSGWDPARLSQAGASFRIPLAPGGSNSFPYLRPSVYNAATRRFVPILGTNALTGSAFERDTKFPVPHWFLNLRTRVKFYLIDFGTAQLVDYVNLDQVEQPLDIANILTWGGNCGDPGTPYVPNGEDGSMWCTNRWRDPTGTNINQPTFGILNQMAIGLDVIPPNNWNSFQLYQTDKNGAIDFFRAQFDLSPNYYANSIFLKTNVFYAPFVPTREVHFRTEWQANDPLVHYTMGDLVDLWDNFQTNRVQFVSGYNTNNLGGINRRYEPWEGGGMPTRSSSSTLTNMAVKDPLVFRPDDWEFPTNKFPNVGWLGRVHRGTPWQTINLKSPMLSWQRQTEWQKWSGNGVFVRNRGQFLTNVVPFNFITNDAAFTHPVNDRYILDLFTTSVNDNASRGQLSVNQTNLAAWSAVLSGVNVMPNAYTNTYIQPAGTYAMTNLPAVARIVAGIQRTMATNNPGGSFRRLGDILAVPELTVNSPLLLSRRAFGRDVSDAAYERIPQQILGLLKGAEQPRFVIYAYGQTLKPADRSLVPNGIYAGLCTNYQIAAEVATRTVVRIEGAPTYPKPFGPGEPLTNLRAVVESFNTLPPD